MRVLFSHYQRRAAAVKHCAATATCHPALLLSRHQALPVTDLACPRTVSKRTQPVEKGMGGKQRAPLSMERPGARSSWNKALLAGECRQDDARRSAGKRTPAPAPVA